MLSSSYAGFRRHLLTWYDKSKRDLPWRGTKNPYKIWVSEVMLQQTTVATVIAYYNRWVRLFPTVAALAAAPLSKVLKAWEGLGYYQRARNIHRAAQEICEKSDGIIPPDAQRLGSLPGFGPYTTHAVLSIAFDRRLTIVDANVRRVTMRLLAWRGSPSPKRDKEIVAFLDDLLPRKRVGDFNQALMELGALVCRSASPACRICPVRPHCEAYRQGLQDAIPEARPKRAEYIKAVCGVIEHRGRYFIQRRPPRGLLAGLWEFPGGKIEKGEGAEEALRRELKEELGVDLARSESLALIRHAYTKFRVFLRAYRCAVRPWPRADKDHRWVKRGEFRRYPMPSATVRIVEQLRPKERER
jgi:A/G-specific adenine glycosylase